MTDVLLIEDNDDDAFAIKRCLEKNSKNKYNLYRARTMMEALALLRSMKPIDVVLLDLGLPDTRDAIDTIRKIEDFVQNVPVIVLTGNEGRHIALSAIDKGAEDFIRKSSVINRNGKLCEAVEFAIHRHLYHRRIVSDKEQVIDWMVGQYSVTDAA